MDGLKFIKMRIAFSVLELDRPHNSNLIRKRLSFLEEMPAVVCNGYKEYPECTYEFPEYNHIFNPHLTNQHHSVGLWISVIKTLKKFVESNYDALLMLEDDVELVPDFQGKFLSCVEELPPDWGLFSLGYWRLFLDNYSEEVHLKSIDPPTVMVCRCFQTGVSWGWLYKREYVIELLQQLRLNNNSVHGMHDIAILSLFGHHLNLMPTNWKAYSIRPSIGSLCYDGRYHPTFRPEEGEGLAKDASKEELEKLDLQAQHLGPNPLPPLPSHRPHFHRPHI